MNQSRRTVLRGTVSSTLLTVAVAAGLLRPGQAFAALENSPSRERLQENLLALRYSNPTATTAIRIHAPDIAVDGASVFISIDSTLPEVESLMVFVDRNPQPLAAAFQLAAEVPPELQMRIKLSQTANIWVIARSQGQYYKAAKTVTVTVGGCGAGVN